MEIEQVEPKKSNFPLVVALFCVTLLIFFALAYLFLDFEGGHIRFHQHLAHPTSQMTVPVASLAA